MLALSRSSPCLNMEDWGYCDLSVSLCLREHPDSLIVCFKVCRSALLRLVRRLLGTKLLSHALGRSR
jgi:hypothetical protein